VSRRDRVRNSLGSRRARSGAARLGAEHGAWIAGAVLLVVYLATLAPDVTFWDAGEFIAAAHVLGIPHPPGTPLYVALAHVWSQALGGVMGVARAINLLSAACTAAAGASMAWLIARRTRSAAGAWAGVAGAIAAGLMTSVWSNATETEVYSLALLHSVALLTTAAMAGEGGQRDERWLLLTAYLIALAPAVHLSALVAVPAAIVLAARRPAPANQRTRWEVDRVLLLGGALFASAGVGRMDWRIVMAGFAVASARSLALPRCAACASRDRIRQDGKIISTKRWCIRAR